MRDDVAGSSALSPVVVVAVVVVVPYVFSGCPPFPGPDLGFNFRTAQLHPSACGPVAVFVLVLALAFVPSVTSRGPRKCCPESGRNFSSAPKARWLLEKLLVCHLASRYARNKKRDARCEKQETRYGIRDSSALKRSQALSSA